MHTGLCLGDCFAAITAGPAGVLVTSDAHFDNVPGVRVLEIQMTKRKRAKAKLNRSRPAAPPRLPDFLARLKKICGNRQAKVSGAELVARDRGGL